MPQKTVEGEDIKDPMKGMKGALFSFVVSDIVSHDKGDKKSYCLFAEIKQSGERVGTANFNIHLRREGIEPFMKMMGAKIALKTPLMGELFIPEGEILDHWEDNKPEESPPKAV